ncbi:putative molybdenum cofactor biosynthesis protein 1 b protein [Coleophoma crateriformis]|uniref:Putative molybdenum cofactor biosynthesis protein 1 b protein n=1 Tax=Coleophoma crateriformis TaxID=565419 RepID=A0A3D8RWR7_9HELO|nr:putative molybdenum cofactor biosynthesis protein 1 b protein [Coleophoma crateriformis]
MASLSLRRSPICAGGKQHPLLTHVSRRYVASAAPAVRQTPRHDIPPDDSLVSPENTRRTAIKNAKPFSSFLTDTFQRQHDYLRISITEKCNLRCLYCMPEEGVPQSPPPDLLTTPEIFLLSSIFVSQGVTKIRLTGGEPTVRKDILPLMHQIGSLRSSGLRELCLTTNGISLFRKLDSMVEAGLTGVNLSLDTLDPWQFQIMTRRKGFEAVMKSIERILEMNKLGAGIKLKINCVVMRGMNDKEILPFVELGREKDLEVRFIEYMPFDGNKWSQGKMLGYGEMLDVIRTKYPGLEKVQDHKNDTSKTYRVPGFVGKMGFITSMTHNFCGSCNRLRITSDGNLKVCLFGNAEVSLRDILRKSNFDQPIDEQAFEAMRNIEMGRRQGLTGTKYPSGIAPNEKELLDVIGLAVSRKKEKHAGMGELENMKNRPMILIDDMSLLYHRARFSINRSTNRNIGHQGRGLGWHKISTHLLSSPCTHISMRYASSRAGADPLPATDPRTTPTPKLTHLTASGSAHMVAISDKSPSKRTATAVCSIYFSNPAALPLILENRAKKGDVLGVARIAGIMAAKKTSDLIPLCHPIAITHVSIELEALASHSTGPDSEALHTPGTTNQQSALFGRVDVVATVSCDGKTGVEMEALTAASAAALTVYDMCKAVDKGMVIEGLRVTRKEGGKSGVWVNGEQGVDGS